MGKFFKLFLKHKKLAAVLGVSLALLLVFAFLGSLKGQLMMALLSTAFLFATVTVGGFIWMKSKPKRSVVFKVDFQYKEPAFQIFSLGGRHKLKARILATTSEKGENKEVYEKVLDLEVRPKKGEDLLGWFRQQIEEEIEKGTRILLAQNAGQQIQVDESFREEMKGWQKRDGKVIDVEVED